MKYSILKIAISFASFMILAVNSIYGYCTSCHNYCDDNCEPCPSGWFVEPNDPYNIIPCDTWFVTGEALCWQAIVGGLKFENGPLFPLPDHHHKPKMHYQWDVGFRLGLGYNFLSSNWDTAVYFTNIYLNAKGNHNHHHHKTEWALNYNTLDLVVGYLFEYFNDCLIVRPYGGARGFWTKQILQRQIPLLLANGSDNERLKIKNRQDLWSAGPLAGVEVNWNYGCGYSIFGDVSTGILFAHYDIVNKEKISHQHSIQFGKRNHNSTVAVVDSALGFSWHTYYTDEQYLLFSLAVENHHYFDYNHIGGSGDLNVNGFVLNATVGF